MTTKPALVILFAHASIALLVAQMASPNATYLSGQVLNSSYFGFSYRVPENLISDTREMEHQVRKHGAFLATSTTVVVFSAFEPPSPAKRRQGVTIAAYNVGTRTARIYEEEKEHSLKAHGWTVLQSSEKVLIGAHEFWRSDYSRAGGYEASVCTGMKGYILEFLLIGGTADDIRALSKSLNTIQFGVGSQVH